MTGVEIAAIGAALPTLAGAAPYLAAGSAVLGAVGAVQSGQQQAAAMRYNASVTQNNAFTAERDANAEAARLGDQNRRRMATATAAQGASGADLSSGSPLDVLADLAGEARLDEEILRWRGRTQGQSLRASAAFERTQAPAASRAGYASGATTLLGGLGRAAGAASAYGEGRLEERR